MSASVTTIFNAALVHLGEGRRVMDPEEDTPRARILAERYPDLRDALLRSYRWNFNNMRARLPADAEPPAFGYARRYKAPVDCLIVRNVVGERDFPWSYEGGYILTDIEAPLSIHYGRQVADPAEFDAIFREVLAIDLAIACSPVIGNKRTLKVDLAGARADLMERAALVDAMEGQEEDLEQGMWLAARFG